MAFTAEDIPDTDLLFKWIPRSRFQNDGCPDPNFLVDIGSGMSTSWNKYATALDCKNSTNRPESVGVVSFDVKKVRALLLSVEHTPKHWSQAHSDVKGPKTAEIQVKLSRMAEMAVKPEPPKPNKHEKKRRK